jgi:hypothetical protein
MHASPLQITDFFMALGFFFFSLGMTHWSFLFPSFCRYTDGNDFITFTDCSGVAYADAGNDELRGQADATVELHGGSGDDILFVGARLFGKGDDDTLTGDVTPNFFSCSTGIDTMNNFNAAEGNTKTADCENF